MTVIASPSPNPSQEVITEDNIETQPIGPLWQAATGDAQADTNNALRAAQGELGYRLALPWLMIIAPMLAVPLAQCVHAKGVGCVYFPLSYYLSAVR
ncbi:hypothetical protein PKHYL_00900 [Psychrobacter sp. KH172YL61]|nr:hypothetical protein PKHYL_00900 [Psychrobacter sp. KH172YL61]